MKPVIFGPILQKRNVDKIAFIRVDQNFPFFTAVHRSLSIGTKFPSKSFQVLLESLSCQKTRF